MIQEPFQSEFSQAVFRGKYPFTPDETWHGCADRVTKHVMAALYNAPKRSGHAPAYDRADTINGLIRRREFMPGGRYLYGSGRDFHQVNNCLLMRAEDSREGWSTLKHNSMMALMTGAGIGVYYGDVRGSNSPVGRTGGRASGPIPLMVSVDRDGKASVQGGDRRCAIWAGLPWDHPDVMEFINKKDWPSWVRAAIEKRDQGDPAYRDFHADLEMTNVSVCLNDAFFAAYSDRLHPMHTKARWVYQVAVSKMVTTGEPGFSVDIGNNAGEVLRNAPIVGETHVLTDHGYAQVSSLVGRPTTVWTGRRWAPNVVFAQTASDTPVVTVRISGGREITCDPSHPFMVEQWAGAGKARRLDAIVRVAAEKLQPGDILHVSPAPATDDEYRDDDYELGYLYGDGSFVEGRAEVTFCSPESMEVAASFTGHSTLNPHDGRGYMRAYYGTDHDRFDGRDKAKFPDDVGYLRSFIAGLFDADGNYEPKQQRIRLGSKHAGFLRAAARALETLGIIANVSKNGSATYSTNQQWQLVVMRDYNDLFAAMIPTRRLKIPEFKGAGYRRSVLRVKSVDPAGRADVFCADVKVAEHSFMAEGVIISNCTEITSADDSDVCNLGSLVLPRFSSPKAFGDAVRDAALFLTSGTLYSDVSYAKVAEVRENNRRLGLGLIGVHEFCLLNGVAYGSDASFEALEPYMREYDRALEYAHDWQGKLGLSRSVAAQALAPNGTIGIVAESTPSADPMFSAARERVVTTSTPSGDVRTVHVVIDPVAKKLVNLGVRPENIEDAYSLANSHGGLERRLGMQAYLQSHVDQAVSSTVNLPYVMLDPQDQREFGDTLMRYLPRLRGITAYPDGARAGQPLRPIPLVDAIAREGETWVEGVEDICRGGVCGV